MDPVTVAGLGASIISLIQGVDAIIQFGKDFYNAITEREKLIIEVRNFRSLLMILHERVNKSQPDDPWLRGLQQLPGTFDKDGKFVPNPKGTPIGIIPQLTGILSAMAEKLIPSSRLKRLEIYQRSTWHWDKTTYSEMLATIARYCTTISTILGLHHSEVLDLLKDNTAKLLEAGQETNFRLSDFSDRLKNIEDGQRRLKEEAERITIKDWLSPLAFQARQKELFSDCFKVKIGQWLLGSITFQNWKEGRPWHLRCYAELGSGKTVLSSIIVEHLMKLYKGRDRPVLVLYLDHKASNTQTIVNLFGNLLQQLIELKGSDPLPQGLLNLYHRANKSKPNLEDICGILREELARYDRFYLIVDAHDEASQSYRNSNLLLREIGKLRLKKMSLIVTYRESQEENPTIYTCDRCPADTGANKENLKIYYPCKKCPFGKFTICQECKEKGLCCLDHPDQLFDRVEVDARTPDEDIERYVKSEIGAEVQDDDITESLGTTRFQDLCRSDEKLLKKIPPAVVQKAKGRFLWARLYMDSLRVKPTVKHIKILLKTFPDKLDDIYQDAMQRIKEQEKDDRKLAYRVLALLSRAHRVLSLAELQHALAVEEWGAGFEDDDESDDNSDDGRNNTKNTKSTDAYYPKKVILDSTAGLVHVDSDDSAVRLVHLTLQPYLLDNAAIWFPEAKVEIAKACLTYLDLAAFAKTCREEEFMTKKKNYAFIAYASKFWGDHVRDCESDPKIQSSATRLVSDPQRLAACIQAAWITDNGEFDNFDVREGLHSLHICAWYGLSYILTSLDLAGVDVDVREPKYGQTPLMYACRKGHSKVAAHLLELGAQASLVSAKGRTAMLEAVAENYHDLVEVLLNSQQSGLDINAIHTKESNRTALMLASCSGKVEIVRLLLQHPEINVNQQDADGSTALSLASKAGCAEIVDLLLKKPHIKVDLVDSGRRSPLRLAAERNYFFIVQSLLDGGADSALEDLQGGTAILRAVDYGGQAALETMIGLGVDLTCKDRDGRGLVHSASTNGYPEILRLLIGEGLDPSLPDHNGITPLHDASRHGKLEVTKVLLDLGAKHLLKDKFHRTPLTVAWQYQKTEIMSLLRLVPLNGEPPEQLPQELPVWSLAALGFKNLISISIETRKDELTMTEPGSENSALHCAIHADEPEVLRILLQDGKMYPDCHNHYLRTPLHLAALTDNLPAVKLLIEFKANLDSEDQWGKTALFYAQSYHYLPIAVALIDAGARVDPASIDVQTLFFKAVELGNVKVVRRLVDDKAHNVDVWAKNSDGTRAIQIAIDADDIEMIRALRSSPSFHYTFHEKNEDEEEGHGASDSMDSVDFEKKMSDRVVPFRPRPITA